MRFDPRSEALTICQNWAAGLPRSQMGPFNCNELEAVSCLVGLAAGGGPVWS